MKRAGFRFSAYFEREEGGRMDKKRFNSIVEAKRWLQHRIVMYPACGCYGIDDDLEDNIILCHPQ